MSVTEFSIAEIEQQIEQVSAALAKAKAQELAQAERAQLAAHKAVDAAQIKVDELKAKGLTTVAAQTRIATAEAELRRQNELLDTASQMLVSLLGKRKMAAKINKRVNKILAKASTNSKSKALKKARKLTKKAVRQEAALLEEARNSAVETIAPPVKKARATPVRKPPTPAPELISETRPLLDSQQSLSPEAGISAAEANPSHRSHGSVEHLDKDRDSLE